MRTSHDEWLGGAKKLPVNSCVSGSLGLKERRVPNTAIRAARERGLSLVQGNAGAVAASAYLSRPTTTGA